MDTANKNKLVIAASSQDRLGVVRLCFMAWLLFYHYSITYGVSFLFELSEQDLSLDVRVRLSATPSDAATAAPGVDNVTAVGGICQRRPERGARQAMHFWISCMNVVTLKLVSRANLDKKENRARFLPC